MSVNVLSAAKELGKCSNWTLSNLEMQKMLYIAHMFFMGTRDGNLLLNGYFEAWDLGPVHPDLYREAKIYGSRPVRNIFHASNDVDDEIKEYLNYSYDFFISIFRIKISCNNSLERWRMEQ